MTTDPQKLYEELKLKQADIFAGVGIGAESDVKCMLADNIPIPQRDRNILWMPKDTPEEIIERLFQAEAGLIPVKHVDA